METLQVVRHPQWVEVTLARPAVRNAMSFQMVDELRQIFRELKEDPQVQSVILRGSGGHFCAGGDVKDMRSILSQSTKKTELSEIEQPNTETDIESHLAQDSLAQANRQFGDMLTEIQSAPQVVIAVLEGSVMGGGFGLACVSDIALALPSARFSLPEVTLGLTPAQIAPFVVKRIGLTQSRRLALTGARFDAETALSYGLIHELCSDEVTLNEYLTQTLTYISKCAPEARAATKALLLSVDQRELPDLLNRASLGFAHAARDGEGMAGMMAFIMKQQPAWRKAWGDISYGSDDQPQTTSTQGSQS